MVLSQDREFVMMFNPVILFLHKLVAEPFSINVEEGLKCFRTVWIEVDPSTRIRIITVLIGKACKTGGLDLDRKKKGYAKLIHSIWESRSYIYICLVLKFHFGFKKTVSTNSKKGSFKRMFGKSFDESIFNVFRMDVKILRP